MRKEWIIDVLADLKAFAEHNGMGATAAGLDDACLVAVAEIASLDHPRAAASLARAPAEPARMGANVTDLLAYRGQA